MSDFLTKRTKFCCTASPAVNFTISADGKVTHKDSKVLTTSAKLSGMGLCTILKSQCQFQQTAWKNPDFKHKANGNNLLTDQSFCNCPVGPIVKVRAAFARNFKQGDFSALNADVVKSITDEKNNSEKKKFQKNISEQKNFDKKIDERKNSEITNNNLQENKLTKANKVADSVEYKLRCLECEKKNCKYRLESFGEMSDTVNSNSAELKKNYDEYLGTTKNFTVADEVYKRSLEFNGSWKYAAHHIISGNQVFKQVPEVVKIANLCKYDINCAENCIMLPSYREGHGDLNELSKSASAFDVMSTTGMQWHVGGHSYNFNSEELQDIKKQILKRTGKAGKIKNYAELLIEELRKIKFSTGEKICPAQFITRMNRISAKVCDKLSAFYENPAASYPYYVSKEAYLFAFKIPRLRKFIAVGKVGENLNLKIFKTVGAGNDIVQQNNLLSSDSTEIIKFCGNIQHFIFLKNTGEKNLPFKPEFSRSVKDFNFDGVSEVIVWLRNNPAENYVAPARKILERMGNMK